MQDENCSPEPSENKWSYNQPHMHSILGRLNVGIAQTEANGRFVVVNEEYCRITGYSAAEMQQMTLMQITHPDDLRINLPLFQKCVELGEPFVIEKRYIHKTGKLVWVKNSVSSSAISDKPQLLTAVCVDITEEKAKEAALRKSEERYQHFIQRTTEGIWCFEADHPLDINTPVDEQIQYFFEHAYLSECNDAMARMYGIDKAELLIGARVADFFPRDERTTAYFRSFIESGYLLTDAESLEMTKHAGMRYFSNNLLGIIENGLLYRCWGTQRDITDQRIIEEKLRESEKRLRADINDSKSLTEKLEKLVAERTAALQLSNESLRQFAHVASHDLKEPVRKISLFANRLSGLAGESVSPAMASLLTKIEAAAQRMRNMIDGVLEFSSISGAQPTMEATDLQEIFSGIRSDLEIIIEKKTATISWGRLPVVRGVTILLHQLFYNLINNALKFSHASRQPVINITSESDGKFVLIKVADNGIGFSNDYADEIFKPFTRLHSKDQYEGTGLGLSMCRTIAQRLGGGITVNSVPGIGSEFTVKLLRDA